MKRTLCALLYVALLLVLPSCNTSQPQVSSEEPLTDEDHHYRQIERFATAPQVPVTLTNLFGESLEFTAAHSDEGYLIAEGDMIVGQLGDLSSQGHWRTGVKRWPAGIIPYEIRSGVSSRQREDIRFAMEHIMAHTDVDFVPRTTQTDYIQFKVPNDGVSCASSVGRVGGYQAVLVAEACGRHDIIHLLGHTLGLVHEHSRLDRDSYVKLFCNVIDCNNPAYQKTNGTPFGPYDYFSVMHFRAYKGLLASGNRVQIMAPVKAGIGTEAIGGYVLSSGDVKTIQHLYAQMETDAQGRVLRAGGQPFVANGTNIFSHGTRVSPGGMVAQNLARWSDTRLEDWLKDLKHNKGVNALRVNREDSQLPPTRTNSF
jgi:hypothetical protein